MYGAGLLIIFILCFRDGLCLCTDTEITCVDGTCIPEDQIRNGTSVCPEIKDIGIILGASCNVTPDCAGINHTKCMDNVCTCITGYYENIDQKMCVQRRLFDTCENDTDCSLAVEGSSCVDEICACNTGQKPSTDNTTCLYNTLGDVCDTDQDCVHVEHVLCSNNTCSCISGYHLSNDTCTRRRIFEYCNINTDCSDAVLNSSCTNNTCFCDTGYIESSGLSECRPIRIDDTCVNDTDCNVSIPHSNCFNETCTCETGYTESQGLSECRPIRIDDTCVNDIDCNVSISHSLCINDTCMCQVGYTSAGNGDECVLRRIGDEGCLVNTDCTAAVSDSECSNGTCSCLSGLVSTYNNTACLTRVVRSVCTMDVECSEAVNNSMCDDSSGTCFCVDGYKSVQMNTACVERVLHDTCVSDTDCNSSIPYSICIDDHCTCKWGYMTSEDGEFCELRHLGDTCHVDTDCDEAVANSRCNNDTAENGTMSCECGPGFKADGNDTCIVKNINDDCEDDLDCILAVNNSVCVANKCKCEVGFHVNKLKTECIRRRVFDRTCHLVADCSRAVSNSYCLNRQCVCNSGFYPSNENQNCTRYRIGDRNCKGLLDCTMAVDMSTCQKGECVCNNGYMPVNNGTICQKRVIGDTCSVDKDCYPAVFRSSCNVSECECSAGYEPIPELTQCVYKPVRLLEECSFQDQCTRLDNRSICNDNLFQAASAGIKACLCEGEYRARTDTWTCYVPRVIGDYCEDRSWCQFAENALCNTSNMCTCRPGFIPNATYDGCVHVPRAVGDYCRSNSNCEAIKNSTCHVNSTCQCTYKNYPRGDGKTCLKRPFMKVPEVPYVEIGLQCDTYSGRPCNKNEVGRKHTRCGREAGRQHSRCLCVPGFASRYNSPVFKCEEVQTYYFNINITLERGCGVENKADDKLCYIYQPIHVRKQYNNPKTRYYLYIRDRIMLAGLAHLFNDTSERVRQRYISSEILNVTEVETGMRVGLLIYLVADYFNIINDTELKEEIISSLIRSDGELGKSQLKLVWPFETEIEYKDFDECSERGGNFSDCSPIAWCLNTRVSYMCSCKHGFEDWSPDPFNRPGRACIIPRETTTDSLSCSNGKCENQWEYISLALIGFVLMLFVFIGYEIYSRKKKLEKSDIYFKLQKEARKSKLKALRERRKTIKKKEKEEKRNKKKWADMAENKDEPETRDTEEQAGEVINDHDEEQLIEDAAYDTDTIPEEAYVYDDEEIPEEAYVYDDEEMI